MSWHLFGTRTSATPMLIYTGHHIFSLSGLPTSVVMVHNVTWIIGGKSEMALVVFHVETSLETITNPTNSGTVCKGPQPPHHCTCWCTRSLMCLSVDTLRPTKNGHHFTDDIFECIFLNENSWISIKISLKFVPKGPINNIPSLVQIMVWRRPGDKPLSEQMMVNLLTHIYVAEVYTSLKFILKDQISNIPALVQIMVWRRPGDKPLSEPVVVSLLMHLCVTRPQWIKNIFSHHRVFSTMEHLTIQSLGALWVWTIPKLTRAVTHCVLITGGFNGSDKITKHCQKQHFLPAEFWPLGIVVAWVCLSLCMCVNPKLVHTKTDHQYKLEPLNLVKRCKTPWLRSLLFWGAIDLDLQGET